MLVSQIGKNLEEFDWWKGLSISSSHTALLKISHILLIMYSYYRVVGRDCDVGILWNVRVPKPPIVGKRLKMIFIRSLDLNFIIY